MLARVIYVKGNKSSEKAKDILERSLIMYDWNYEIVEGCTRETLNENEFPYPDLEGGRLESFRLNNNPVEQRKYQTKKACLFNNLRFAQDVIDAGEPMIFLEHDVKVIDRMPKSDGITDFCFLNMDYAFRPPTALAKSPFKEWSERLSSKLGVQPFPNDYPLKSYKDSRYYGKSMTPGTSAYILTPTGAERLLNAVAEFGLEQSDFIINQGVLDMDYVHPSPVKFQKVNPNLSHSL